MTPVGSTCCHQINTDQKLVPDVTPRYLEQLSDILSSVTSNEQQLHCVLVLLNLSMQSLDSVTPDLVNSITILREQVCRCAVCRCTLFRCAVCRCTVGSAYCIVYTSWFHCNIK